jgi:hypothetical protein
MKLTDFPRPANGSRRGIHWSAAVFHPTGSSLEWWIKELLDMNTRWVKLLDNGWGSSKHVCQKLLDNEIIPIVRMYRSRPNPGHLSEQDRQTISELVALGVRYFECNNEPNLPVEWQEGEWQTGGRPEVVMQHWLQDAEAIIGLGGFPAFPALAQCGNHSEHGSIPWYISAFQWLDEHARANALNVFDNGAWIAAHDAVLNHCYKDDDGEWHFDYPYDPICQADQPGKTIMDDDNSLIGHHVPVQLLEEHFGLQVPVISTEGGVFAPQGGWQQFDTRYPGYNYNGHAERTVAMFEWLRTNAEDYFFAMCPWLIANQRMGHVDPAWTESAWYRMDNELPVIAAIKAIGPEPMLPPPLPLDERLRNASWNRRGLAYNRDAAFSSYARQHNLGSPLTGEFDVVWEGKTYRVQGFTGAIVYAEVGHWGQIRRLRW